MQWGTQYCCGCVLQVWIIYKRDAIGPNYFTRGTTPTYTLEQILAMPRGAPLRTSSSAWWSKPGPLQPHQHRAWECFKPGYDPVAQQWEVDSHKQQQQQVENMEGEVEVLEATAADLGEGPQLAGGQKQRIIEDGSIQ